MLTNGRATKLALLEQQRRERAELEARHALERAELRERERRQRRAPVSPSRKT